MQAESWIDTLEANLKEKSKDSSAHRKAEGILRSLMQASRAIPNFQAQFGQQDKTLALYVTGGIHKLFQRAVKGEEQLYHNIDAYLLLLNMALPIVSINTLLRSGVAQQLMISAQWALTRKDSSPIEVRLAVGVLSHCLAPNLTTNTFKVGEERKMLARLFEKAISSPRNSALSKECSKLLVHMVRNNPWVGGVLGEEAKTSLFSSLEERKQLYFGNVREVMLELPMQLLNDVCHRVASNLSHLDPSDPTLEQYLAQTYFFLDKMAPRLAAATLEDILLVVVNAVPAGTQHQKVTLSYLQLLSDTTKALADANSAACSKLLSPVVAVMIELLLGENKVGKFAHNQLVYILKQCITPSLWSKGGRDEWDLQAINLDDSHSFGKLLALLKGLLSSRFPNTRGVSMILSTFFSSLAPQTLPQSTELIADVVNRRQQMHDKQFKRIFQSIICSYGVEEMLKMYPMRISGDIASQSFQDDNNLWMLTSLERTEAYSKMGIFCREFLPLIHLSRQYQQTTNISPQRKQAYHLLEDLLWRCTKIFAKTLDPSCNYDQVLSLIEGQLKRSQDSTILQLARALQLLSEVLAPLKRTSPSAQICIKTLANILDISKGNAKQLQSAIRGLSTLAPAEYVRRVFDKNIEKLITLCQSGNLFKEESKNLKNLEILMAVNGGIDLEDPAVTTSFRLSRQQLLTRLVGGLVRSTGSFQKKGYKYLVEVLGAAPRSFRLEVLQMLGGVTKVEPGAKFHRLNVVAMLWAWVRQEDEEQIERIMQFIKTFLPEVLLATREQNKAARGQATRIVGEFTQTMTDLDIYSNFVEIVCAGLISDRSQTKLATLSGLSIIIGRKNCDADLFRDVLEISLMLLNQKRQQIYRGVVEFCRKGIFGQPIDRQREYLPKVLQCLLENDEEGKMQNRSQLKHFLIKLVKRHGRDQIERMMPTEHLKLLTHALKMEVREKRKRKEHKQALEQQKGQVKQKEESSSESEAEEQAQHGRTGNEMEEELQPLEQNQNDLLLKYDLDQEQFHFHQPTIQNKKTAKNQESDKQEEITFDTNGMMIINQRKRPQAEESKQEDATTEQANKSNNFKKKPKPQVHQVKESGSAYRSNRAGGDIPLRDQPEPYAFIQFSSKALNKRFKKRAESTFDYLFQRKEGGLKGLKSTLARRR